MEKTTIYDLVVIDGIVVTDTVIEEWDIAIDNEKIAETVPRGHLQGVKASRTIDALGGYVCPGGVDAHLHLQEPPLFGKGSTADNYETGSRSAVCGGTTTMITFAPQKKTEDTLLDTLAATYNRAKNNCYIDCSFHLLIGNTSSQALSEFQTLPLQLHDAQILDVPLEARKQQITTIIHAENNHIIDWMTTHLEKRRLFAPNIMLHHTRPLSESMDAPILIVHVSTPQAAAHIKTAQDCRLPVFAETCPQYLFLTKKNLDQPGFEESEEDCDAIWAGLANGTFTYNNTETGKKSSVSEDLPLGHFKYIPNGCSGIETRLPLTLSAGRLNLKKFVEVTSTTPARLHGLWSLKGAFIEGKSDADINIWYPERKMQEFELKNEMLHHGVDYTPFKRGIVWDRENGGLLGEIGYGKFSIILILYLE
ncbi:hypothetical protein GQ44DRAFT_742249 [Phaeosphaeriaceae sp. PMI808]|nr:hypothetical protein GQ44DRAFT_742249 [Phaeosphaeriaceae sp. PMI808]